MGAIFESLSGARGLRTEGKSAQNIAEFNAKVAEQQAKAEELRSGFDQIQQAKEAERIKSLLSARIGAAGGAGSPVALDIKLEQAEELELENLLIGFEGQVKSQRLRSQATLSRLQGQLAKQRGKSAARRANIGFGLSLASLALPFIGGFGGTTTPGLGTGGASFPTGLGP